MSVLSEFCKKGRGDSEGLVKALEKLTKECQLEENRQTLNKQILLDLSSIMQDIVSRDGSDARKKEYETLVESFRFLRNCVINCKENQDFIRDNTELILYGMDFLKCHSKDKESMNNETLLVAIRCCLQFIANFMVNNEQNCEAISKNVNETLCVLLKSSEDEKVIQYSAMGLHLVLKLNPAWVEEMDTVFIPQLFKHTHLEFIMFVIEALATNEVFIQTKYTELECEHRVSFLKILVAHSEVHQHLTQSIIEFFADQFKSKSDSILKSQIETDEWACWEVATILELLCCISTMENVLKEDSSLLTTSVFLLRSVHAVGKASSLVENQFTPIQSLSKQSVNAETEDMRSSPTFQFKAHLIRLVGNLVHRNFSNQEMVREMEGLAVVLDCCQIDARNPFITQWAVLAIRNLCEGNPANQEFIREVQRVDTENKLPSLQMIGL